MKRAVLAAWFFVLAIAAAGVFKAIDIKSFYETLGSWTLIPTNARMAVAVLVPSIEISLGAWFLTGIARRRCLMISAVMLSLVTTAWLVQGAIAEVPECGCFGAFEEVFSLKDQAWWVAVRNGGLLVVGVYASCCYPIHERPTGFGGPSGRSGEPTAGVV